jgi:hypothetical protein
LNPRPSRITVGRGRDIGTEGSEADEWKLERPRAGGHVCAASRAGGDAASASAHGALPITKSNALFSTYCGAGGTQGLGALARLTGSGYAMSARGADAGVKEPSLGDAPDEAPHVKKDKPFHATVDVYFHVIHDGATGNVSNQAIADQITVMNLGYGGMEGGFNTGFSFKVVGIDRTDNAAWFNAQAGSADERAMKAALHQGDASDLNIYSSTAEAYLGWAYFPSTYKVHPTIDGLVIDWESMSGTSTRYAGRYDLGKTATHESGHWFGLYHVFQGGCNNWGDYVDDTPPQLIATRGCPEGQDSCKEPGFDSIHNYMDYSYDSCYNQFTAGQAARMQDQWLAFRADGGSTVK